MGRQRPEERDAPGKHGEGLSRPGPAGHAAGMVPGQAGEASGASVPNSGPQLTPKPGIKALSVWA